MTDPYVLSRDGERIYEGDYVQCRVHDYSSLRFNERRRVISIRPYDCIKLNNPQSPRGASDYKASAFRLAGRYHAYHRNPDRYEQENKPMIHIAVRMTVDADLVDYVNKHPQHIEILAGRAKEEIQERIRTRLSQYPDEKWLICSGNTIGERADPPVRFRSI